MIVERLGALRRPSDALALLPTQFHVLEVVRSYHPVVLGAGIGGACLLSRRLAGLLAAGLALSLYSVTSYSAPWAATVAYPFVYAGAAHACVVAGRAAAAALLALPRIAGPARLAWLPRGGPLALVAPPPSAAARLAGGLACLAAAVLAALTNLDLAGDTRFLLTWWAYFAGRYLF
jgi:hypothetical protein